jgi:hypothetical protein
MFDSVAGAYASGESTLFGTRVTRSDDFMPIGLLLEAHCNFFEKIK